MLANRPWLVWTAAWLLGVAGACGGTQVDNPNGEPGRQPLAPLCDRPSEETIGVTPIGNQTEAAVDLAGTEDLLMTAMTESRCYKVIEREKLQLLIEEMRLCSDENPDREYMDCDSFAQRGRLLGLRRLVVGDLIFFEKSVRGAEFSAQFPSVGGVGADVEYSALALSLRELDVETGRVLASTVVHALVEAASAGIDLGGGEFGLKATVFTRTAMGSALDEMIKDAVRRLHAAEGAAPSSD